VKVEHTPNWLYVLDLNITRPVCLATQGSSAAWRWHARYSHLNFKGLRWLADDNMVSGLPQLDQVDQVCDSCLTREAVTTLIL
jgi:hypothetical protein